MAVKSLLLDIDGVLVRDKLLLEHVKSNCVDYVRAKLPECKDPMMTNKHLYMAHGHTARGLRTVFQMDVSDFNEKVYDKRVIDHLAEVIYGSEFQLEAKELYELTKRGWDVTLFTNSPPVWAMPVAMAIGDTIKVKCCGPNAKTSFFKPEAAMYNDFAQTQTHIYVDDSLKNLATARFLNNWHPVYFNEGPKEDRLWCPQVGTMWELGLMVNTIDDIVSV